MRRKDELRAEKNGETDRGRDGAGEGRQMDLQIEGGYSFSVINTDTTLTAPSLYVFFLRVLAPFLLIDPLLRRRSHMFI